MNLQHCVPNSEFNNVEEKVFTVWDEHRAAKLNLLNFLSLSPGSNNPGACIWKLSLVSDVTKSLSARNERLTNV